MINFVNLFLFIIVCMMGDHACTMAYMWVSEDDSVELVLSFHLYVVTVLVKVFIL